MLELVETNNTPAEPEHTVEDADSTDNAKISSLAKMYTAAAKSDVSARQKTAAFVKAGYFYIRPFYSSAAATNGKLELNGELQNRCDRIRGFKKNNHYNPVLLTLWAIIGVPEKPTDADESRNTKIANAWKLALLEQWDEENFDKKYQKIGGLSGMSKECQSRFSSQSTAKGKSTKKISNMRVVRNYAAPAAKPALLVTADENNDVPAPNSKYAAGAKAVIRLNADVPAEFAEGSWKVLAILSDGYLYIQSGKPAGFFPKPNADELAALEAVVCSVPSNATIEIGAKQMSMEEVQP